MVEAVHNYVTMVNGLTKMTRDRALQTARALLAHAGLEKVANEAEGRLNRLAEEVLAASRANRELVENLVAGEVNKAAARWGFVRSDDVDALREEIAELRRSLVRATVDNATPEPAPQQRTKPAAKKAAAKKAAAKKSTAKKSSATTRTATAPSAAAASTPTADEPKGEQ